MKYNYDVLVEAAEILDESILELVLEEAIYDICKKNPEMMDIFENYIYLVENGVLADEHDDAMDEIIAEALFNNLIPYSDLLLEVESLMGRDANSGHSFFGSNSGLTDEQKKLLQSTKKTSDQQKADNEALQKKLETTKGSSNKEIKPIERRTPGKTSELMGKELSPRQQEIQSAANKAIVAGSVGGTLDSGSTSNIRSAYGSEIKKLSDEKKDLEGKYDAAANAATERGKALEAAKAAHQRSRDFRNTWKGVFHVFKKKLGTTAVGKAYTNAKARLANLRKTK